MASESKFWSNLKGKLGPGHFVRVENPCDPGTPDVNFCLHPYEEGWIETKYRAHRLRESSIVLGKRHGVRASQKIWIRQRLEVKGLVLLVIGVHDEVFFVHGAHAPTINGYRLKTLRQCALTHASRRDPTAVEVAFHLALAEYRTAASKIAA